MMNRFEELLVVLGGECGVALHLDHRGACQLNIDGILHVQLSYEEEMQRLLIATFVCETPPGRFRENLFKMALKHNRLFPWGATLSYSERNNQLCLFRHMSLSLFQEQSLSSVLQPFIGMAKEWRSGVETGALQGLLSGVAQKSSGMFGL